MSKEQKMIKKEFAKLVKDLVTENAGEMEDKQEIPKTTTMGLLPLAWVACCSVCLQIR